MKKTVRVLTGLGQERVMTADTDIAADRIEDTAAHREAVWKPICSGKEAHRILPELQSWTDYLKVCGIVVRICKSDTADRFLLADRTV